MVATTDSLANPRHLDLNGLFRRLTVAYPDLCCPSEIALTPLNSELERARRKERTIEYIVVITVAITAFAVVPVLLVGAYRIAVSIQPTFENLLRCRKYLDAHPEVPFAAGLAAFAASFYTLVMHQSFVTRLAVRFNIADRLVSVNMDRRDWRFVLYTVVVNYAVLGVVLIYLCNYWAPGNPLAHWAVFAWLYLPVPFFSLLPPLLLMVALVLILGRHELSDDAPEAAVLRELLLLLDMLKDVFTPRELSIQRRRTLMRRIGSIAEMLRDLYRTANIQHSSAVWASRRMGQAADNFLALSSWVAFPKDDTLVELKRRIVRYANVVAAGTYDALPSGEAGEAAGLIKGSPRTATWRQAGGLLALLLLVSVPLTVYAALVTHLRVDIAVGLRPAVAVVYSGWVVLCLLAYMDRLAPEAKTTLLELIRLVFRR